jgi:large subunit ribosomal protein L6
MSRIGKHPVAVPAGVKVALAGQRLTVSGKLGELSRTLPNEIRLAQEDGALTVQPREESARARAMWGLSRTLVANMVEGVSKGFTRKLVISGVGFRAAVDGKILNLQLGYSHDIKYAIPDDIDVRCESPTAITISGADRQLVGQIAAELRAFRLPEPYKGKGIRYDDEVIRRKEGKKK